jgi:hypothetical protein
MLTRTLFTSLLATSALVLSVAPAEAGKGDRARQAIAAAEAKVRTADSLGAGVEAPREAAEARAALATSKEDLMAGRKSLSIREAIRASALADTAIGELQRRKDDSLAAAQVGASMAQDQAAAAQAQAADANAQAESARQAAASSAADAASARAAAALAAQTSPTQVETTVTTQQPATARRSTRTVVKRTTTKPVVSAPPAQVTTTTRVTQP